MNKELAPLRDVVSGTAVVVRGERSFLAGAYNCPAAGYHLLEHHEPGEWCSLDCFARFLFGRATIPHQEQARQKIARLVRWFEEHGELLLVAYDGASGAKSAMRLYRDGEDRAVADLQLERMVRHRDTTNERVGIVLGIIEQKRRLRETP